MLVLSFVLAGILSFVYVNAWNYYHPRLHFMKHKVEYDQLGPYEKWIRRNHALHHLQKGKRKGNHNILLPLGDHMLGTYNYCVDHESYMKTLQNEPSPSEKDLEKIMRKHPFEPIANDVYFCGVNLQKTTLF